jgi:putative peptide zinc metalloprotease protein
MFSRIKPTLASFLPWKETSDRVTELKTWVRGAVTAYVLLVVPLLLFMFAMMVINAPRIFATAWDSFFVQYHTLGNGSAVADVMHVIQMLVLVLPSAGIVYTFVRLGGKVGGGIWSRTEGKPAARAAAVAVGATLIAFMGYIWWPNGEYRPIQKGEKGTIGGAISEINAIPTGRPALTRQRAQELRGAPFRSSKTVQTEQQNTPQATTSTSTSTSATDTTATTATTTQSATSTQTATSSPGGATASAPTATAPAGAETETGPTVTAQTSTTHTTTTP